MMRWLSYVYPQTVLRTSSSYNRDIRVNLENGRYKLLVSGSRESGAYIEDLWKFAFKELHFPALMEMHSILVLGIAGGTVIHLLRSMYPNARITGVDIDPVMIEIGQKYFGLESMKNLDCVCADARSYVAKRRKRYDLVVVDLFVGPDVPDFVLDHRFHQSVSRLLATGGFTMVNYLRQRGYEEKVFRLESLLRSLYGRVASGDRYNNRFFLSSEPQAVVE